MSGSDFNLMGRFVLAIASIAMATSGLLIAGAFAAQAGKASGNKTIPQLLLADQASMGEGTQEGVQLPQAVRDAILQDVSGRTQKQISQFRIVRVSQQTWPDSCLGVGDAGITCTEAAVPGWAVLVASDKQYWVYRADLSGSTVKWDEDASKTVTALRTTETASQRRLSNRTTQTSEAIPRRTTQQTVAESSQVQTSERQTPSKSKQGFALAILQPSGSLSEVIARISLKTKDGNSYFKEKFIGDYKYKLEQKAKFVQGVNPGDRVVVRLYDLKNRLIGFSEFESLFAFTSVKLILPDQPSEYRVVRTVYGVDTDEKGSIESGATVYDYFTQISDAKDTERVTFLSSAKDVKISQFRVEGLPKPPSTSVYPTSFKSGQYALANQSLSVFSDSQSAVLTSTPGKVATVIDVADNNTSTYDVSQMVAKYQQVRVSSETRTQQTALRSAGGNQQIAKVAQPSTQQIATSRVASTRQAAGTQTTGTNFKDISGNYWAKDFIAELVNKKIILGYPDGTYRPDELVTRAEFAAMLSLAFQKNKNRQPITFKDVQTSEWTHSYVLDAYQMGFLDVDSANNFKPEENISRLDIFVALARGLNYLPTGSTNDLLSVYTDVSAIPSPVRTLIAAATEKGIVVSYPNVSLLNPEKQATRAEVAAILYQAMVSNGQATDISSRYVVGKGKKVQ